MSIACPLKACWWGSAAHGLATALGKGSSNVPDLKHLTFSVDFGIALKGAGEMSDLMCLIFHLVPLGSACHWWDLFQTCQPLSKEQRIFRTELKLTVVKCCLVLGDGGPVGTSEGNHRERNNFTSVQSQNENHARYFCVLRSLCSGDSCLLTPPLAGISRCKVWCWVMS